VNKNDIIAPGNTTFRLTIEQWRLNGQPTNLLPQKVICKAPTLDELIAKHIAKLRRVDVELRAIDYVGGW
jgi:hypothetical protein